MIKIYRENYSKKRREKTPATDIGKIEMPALILESGQLMEKWYIRTNGYNCYNLLLLDDMYICTCIIWRKIEYTYHSALGKRP